MTSNPTDWMRDPVYAGLLFQIFLRCYACASAIPSKNTAGISRKRRWAVEGNLRRKCLPDALAEDPIGCFSRRSRCREGLANGASM